jgi:beta-glucanase (GH16 family)
MASTVASVAVTTTSSYVNVGSTVQYSASCKDSAGNIVIVAPSALTWNSSNTAHGQVSSTGLLSGIGGGSTTVSATFNEVESTLAQSPIASTPVPIEVIQSSGFVPVGYNLAWSDEFDGTLGSTPNATNWTYDLGAGGWGNNEQETYTSTNATVISDSQATDGLALDIKATKSGSTYYSSRIKTEGLRSFTYGYIECRAKVPPGGANYQGYWPAFWMLGNSITTVGWPTCGEQDIMEHLSGTAPTNAYQSLHGQNSSGGWDTTQTYTSSPDLGAGYHTYAVLRKQNSITFYVDGIQDGPTKTPSNVGSGNAWEFNQPEFLILNLAVGGNWPGNITGATTFPADYLIDYVRVYQ